MPQLNMDDAYIVLSSDSDVMNDNALVYYVNKTSRMVTRDDSVTNGVVHSIDNVISASNLLLADKIAEVSTLTIFSQALSAGWVLLFLTGKKAILRLRPRNLRLDKIRTKRIVALGHGF